MYMARPKKTDIEKVEQEQRVKTETIIEAIADNATLASVCANEKVKPSTFLRWMEKYELSEQYARARGIRADVLFERIAELDEMLLTGEIDPQTHRALVDSIKWRLGKMSGKYNDKQQIELSGQLRHVLTQEQQDAAMRAWMAREQQHGH